VASSPFFGFLKKFQDGNHLKFGKAFYFFTCPVFGPKNTFQSNSYIFSSKFANLIHILNRNKKSQVKKDYFYLMKKVDIYFEMMQFGTMVPKK